MAKITTSKAPEAFGPYSQGFEADRLVVTSGQIPLDNVSGKIPEGIAAQAEQSCKNVGAVLGAAGVNFKDVIKTTCFLVNMEDFDAFNEVYARYFTTGPARSCVVVRALPRGALCEIEAMAVRPLKNGGSCVKAIK